MRCSFRTVCTRWFAGSSSSVFPPVAKPKASCSRRRPSCSTASRQSPFPSPISTVSAKSPKSRCVVIRTTSTTATFLRPVSARPCCVANTPQPGCSPRTFRSSLLTVPCCFSCRRRPVLRRNQYLIPDRCRWRRNFALSRLVRRSTPRKDALLLALSAFYGEALLSFRNVKDFLEISTVCL